MQKGRIEWLGTGIVQNTNYTPKLNNSPLKSISKPNRKGPSSIPTIFQTSGMGFNPKNIINLQPDRIPTLSKIRTPHLSLELLRVLSPCVYFSPKLATVALCIRNCSGSCSQSKALYTWQVIFRVPSLAFTPLTPRWKPFPPLVVSTSNQGLLRMSCKSQGVQSIYIGFRWLMRKLTDFKTQCFVLWKKKTVFRFRGPLPAGLEKPRFTHTS